MSKYVTIALILAKVEPLVTIEFLKNDDAPAKILQQYPGYEFIVHCDNATKKDLDLFFNDGRGLNPVMQMINYDAFRDAGLCAGHKTVHVVHLKNPFRFGAFSRIVTNLDYHDVVMFVTGNFRDFQRATSDAGTHVWQQEGLHRCGCVVLCDIQMNDVYYVHFYAGNMTGMVNKIRVMNNATHLLRYVNDFTNFNGHMFNVAYYPYAPFIWIENNSRTCECEAHGTDGKLLVLLSEVLNFRFTLKVNTGLRAGGEWKAMIEDVHHELMDWTLGGMSITLEREEISDFTTFNHMESYTAYYTVFGHELERWGNVLGPFNALVWICLAVMLVFVGMVIQAAIRLIVWTKTTKLTKFIEVPLHTVIEQPLPNLRIQINALKVLLSAWFLMSIIITTSYKSKLVASMIKSPRSEPNSVVDLYQDGYNFQMNNEDNTVLKERLQNSVDSRFRKVLERAKDDLNFCSALLKSTSRKIAVIDEETFGQYTVEMLRSRCYGLLTAENMANIRVTKQSLFPSMHGWPLQIRAPYRNRFSKIISRLKALGIIEHWYAVFKTIASASISKSNLNVMDSEPTRSLTISSYFGVAFILLLGQTCAFVVFACELIYFKYGAQ